LLSPVGHRYPVVDHRSHPVSDIITLLHIVLVLAALVLPVIVGVRLLAGPDSEPFAS
jgi:hypothetical protein